MNRRFKTLINIVGLGMTLGVTLSLIVVCAISGFARFAVCLILAFYMCFCGLEENIKRLFE